MMEIKIDGEVVKTFTTTEVAIVCSQIPCFNSWHNAGIINIMQSKVDNCMKRLRAEWVDGGLLAANGVTSIPIDGTQLAELIFAQPNYKNMQTKIDEEATSP